MIAFIFLFLLFFSNNYLMAGKEEIKIITGNDQSLAKLQFANKIDFINRTPENQLAIIPLTEGTTLSTIGVDDFKNSVIADYKKNQSFFEKHSNKIALGAGMFIGAGLVLYWQNASKISIGNEERVR